MKNRFVQLIRPLFLAALIACPGPATAQSQFFWDAASPIDNSPGAGGTGNWDTNNPANTVWWVSGGSDSIWTNGNIANFAGTAGTVTVDAPVTANGLTFATTGYTIGGTSNLTLSSATITLPDNGTETINCPLAGNTTVTINPTTSGPSTLNLGGTNTYTGATTINSGATLTISGSGSLNKGIYAGPITDNGAYIYNSSAVQTNSGTITGAGALTQEGAGTLFLTHANTGYTGAVTINAGSTLQLATVSSAGSQTTIADNGTLNLNAGGAANYAFSVTGGSSSVINLTMAFSAGSENLRFPGPGTLAGFGGTVNLIALNSTGGTNGGTFGAGQLILSVPATILASPGTWHIWPGASLVFQLATTSANVIIDGPGNSQPFGALRLDACTQTGNVLLNGNGVTIGDDSAASPSVISGNISDGGNNYGFSKAIGNPAILTTIVLSGINTYTGPTIFSSAGALQVGSAEVPGVSGPLGKSPASNPGNIVLSGATLQYSAANNYDYSGRFSTNAGQAYNFDVNGQSVTFATPLTSSGSELTLADTAGGGTLTLKATNTYTGITTINGGTLNVSGAITGSTVININGSGNLELSNSTALSLGTVLTLPSTPNANSVQLNFSGTQTILGLYFGGVQQPAGTYNAISNNSSGAFAGTGTLVVAPQIFWDANGTAAASQSSANGGGNGSWDSTTSNWWITGSSDTRWVSNTIANFAGTAGTVTLNTNETAAGLTFATNGYILTGSSNLTLAGTPTIGLPNGGAATINCSIAGTGGLTESGSGTFTLGGSNSFTGPVSIGSSCTLVIGGANAYAGPTTINTGGTLAVTNTGNLDGGNYPGAVANGGAFIYNSSANQTLSGIMSGTGTLTQNGPSTLTLSGLNLFNSQITIGSGSTLAIGGGGDLGNNVTFNTGGYSGTMTDNGAFVYNSSAQQTITSGITGTGALAQTGSGILTLSGQNSYSGTTTIGTNSELLLSGTGDLGVGDYETNIINNGTLLYNSSFPQTLGGTISGSGTLTQGSAGTLTLNGTNTYTGATAITAGTLALGASGSINNSSNISIAANTTLDVSAIPNIFTLSTSNSLSATGTASASAAINGPSSGTVNFGSQPISLTFVPQSSSGDLAHQALTVIQGVLSLNGNPVQVKNSRGSALGVGTYALIQVSSGTISGTASLSGSVTGAGLAAGTTASLSATNGSLNLVVVTAPSVPVINSAVLSSGNLILSGTNGPAGGTYVELTSTNVSLPLASWTPVATNTFSGTGTFSITNAIGGTRGFFTIQVPPP